MHVFCDNVPAMMHHPFHPPAESAANSAIWYPYAQMKTMAPPLRVVSAQGPILRLDDGRELIDGISSWWSVIHGYNHPEITAAAAKQLEQVPHVMLGGLVHPAAERLAEKLTQVAPGDLNHVFFGDSGSVGVEIALKMAIQHFQNQGRKAKKKIAALHKAYHGDTCGAMSVCDPAEGMHKLFAGIVPEQFFLPAPAGGFDAERATVDQDLKKLRTLLGEHSDQIAAFIVEPLMQAAGGFNFYSPAYLQGARQLCDEHDVLLIFDEVATGFGRTGALFAADRAQVVPDIMVLGKALTAGYSGHSATIATDRVFEAFLSDDPAHAFMHGPTFMGNATACAVAIRSLEIFQQQHYLARIAAIEALLKRELFGLSSPLIRETRVLGATAVVEVHDRGALKGLQAFAADRGVWLRPFERYAYTMPGYVLTDEQLLAITGVLRDWFA